MAQKKDVNGVDFLISTLRFGKWLSRNTNPSRGGGLRGLVRRSWPMLMIMLFTAEAMPDRQWPKCGGS
jgi:hypothetical protein